MKEKNLTADFVFTDSRDMTNAEFHKYKNAIKLTLKVPEKARKLYEDQDQSLRYFKRKSL